MRYKLSALFLFVLITLSSGQAHARWLLAQQGRFIGRDPIGYSGGPDGNLYSCVENRPNILIDPSGLINISYPTGQPKSGMSKKGLGYDYTIDWAGLTCPPETSPGCVIL